MLRKLIKCDVKICIVLVKQHPIHVIRYFIIKFLENSKTFHVEQVSFMLTDFMKKNNQKSLSLPILCVSKMDQLTDTQRVEILILKICIILNEIYHNNKQISNNR